MYALLSTLPYLVYLGFHISKKDDKVQKVEIINPEISSKLHKINTMPNTNNSNNNSTNSSTTTTTTTQLPGVNKLPGVNNSQVISSSPKLIKENSQTSSTKKK